MSIQKNSIEIPPELIEEMKRDHASAQRRDDEFVLSVQDLPPLQRAEAWLKHVVKYDQICYGTQEAIVYLISRGNDCTEAVENVIKTWKQDEKHSIELCMKELHVHKIDTGETKEIARKGLSFDDASDVLNQSISRLEDFWGLSDYFVLTGNATMLRTVQWCEIGGFHDWWLRLAKTDYEMIIQGGIDSIPASFYLFNMCRSDFAIELMSKALRKMLEAIELPDYRQIYPWRRWLWEEEPPVPIDNFSYAATLLFANSRLNTKGYDIELANKASEMLLKNQNPEGYWRCWANENDPAFETTAMAIHALAISKPRGWEFAVSTARDWLWSVQDKSGCWIDYGCPDSVYLTVLILDAIELASGGTNITFKIGENREDKAANKDEMLLDIVQRMDKLQTYLGEKIDELKEGQAAIYTQISISSKFTLQVLYKEIHDGRIEQGQLRQTIDAIRRALKHIQTSGLPIGNELKKVLDNIYLAINSDLPFNQKLELTLPIIPFLLEYKVDLGAGVDLGTAWAELIDKIQKAG